MTSQFRVSNLTKTFGSNTIVDQLDLDIQDGEFLVLLGPSGCGKTTTLRCIAGLETPEGGSITFKDHTVFDASTRVNAVCPGSIETAITAGADFADDDMDAYVKSIPLQRRGLPLEVAKAILFLACEDSSYITGSDLMIDGGTSAGARTPKRPTQS